MPLTKVSQHSLGNSAVTTAKINLTTPLGIANSTANVIFMAANGNVGVGTSAPATQLQLTRSNASGDVGLFVSQGADGYTNTTSTVTLYLGATYNATAQAAKIVASHSDGTTGDHGQNLQLWTVNSGSTPTERMRIAANGNVGIGTSTPTAKLEIGGTNPEIRLGPVQTSSGAYMSYDTTNNWFTLNAVTQGVAYRNICFATDGGNVGIGTTSPSEKLQVNGNIYLNSYNLIGRYGTGSSTATNAAELVRFGPDTQIYHDGVTLSSAGQAVIRFCGSRAEVIRMRNNSGYAIYAEAGGITSASDYRIKENITEIPNAWDKVKQINPVEYNVKEDWDYERRNQRQAGFLAHELQALLPSAVGGTKDEIDENGNPVMQGVDYSKVTPLLAAALKQALYKIETLEAKVAALEGNA